MIAAEKITQLTQQIVAIAQPEKVILFGAYAYGQPNEDSDLDIMVILPFEGHWVHKAVEIRQQLPIGNFSLDLRTPQQIKTRLAIGAPFMREIIEQGQILYEKALGQRGEVLCRSGLPLAYSRSAPASIG
jgi:uncharacterized protein